MALAAGGARGAYQAGALLRLVELGLTFDAVAGTSIGSLNAAFYAQGDGSVRHARELVRLWRSLPDAGLIRLQGKAVVAALASLFSADPTTLASVFAQFASGKLTILDPAPVTRVLDGWLDYKKICAAPVDLAVAVLPEISPLFDIVTGPARRVTYLRAREIGPERLRQALQAAGAIPLAFPSRAIGVGKFSDAGLADPLPAMHLRQAGYSRIVSIFLSDTIVQNRSDFPGGLLLQIRPSVTIDMGLRTTFDFSRATIDRLIKLGYRDASESYGTAAKLFAEINNMRDGGARIRALADSLPSGRKQPSPSDLLPPDQTEDDS